MSDADLYVDKMDVNFAKMLPRIKQSLADTDLKALFKTLSEIKGPTLVTGVGGSSVVAVFLAKVLNRKNHILATFKYPRELKMMDLSGYENVIAVSYSGRNIGVDAAFDNNLNKYLFSGAAREGIHSLQYVVKDEEYSFVSMAGTFIPLSIVLMYYHNDFSIVEDMFAKRFKYNLDDEPYYEILSSEHSITAQTMLDSCMVEGSLCAPIISEKYDYCHGRTQYNFHHHSPLIYFDDESGLDTLFKKEVLPTFRKVITMERKYNDEVIDDYYQSYQALNLCYCISEMQHKDMSIKEVPEVSDIVYYYKGEM